VKVFLRTVKEFVYEDVCQHLLVVGELKGDCFSCKEIGIDYLTVKTCPKCSTDFRYISHRTSSGAKSSNFVNIAKRRPDLIYIEFDDMNKQKGKKQAEDFFSK